MIRPGALQPARSPPQITASESVNALTISPDLEMPPSATIETSFLGRNRRSVQSGHLRDTNAGHNSCCTNRTWSLTNFVHCS